MSKYEERIERAKNWPSFKHGSLTRHQRRVVGWLAGFTDKPKKTHIGTLTSLIERGIIEYVDEDLKLTEIGREYAKSMRSCG